MRKVLWTCCELGIDVAREDWGAGYQSPQQARFMSLNPNAMVPVLVDDDFVLWESNAICRYLATAYGALRPTLLPTLLPAEARARARVEQWMDWQATELNNSWRYAFMALVRNSAHHQDRLQIAAGSAGWNRHMAILDQQLATTGAYVTGDQFTLADIVLGLSINRWLMTSIERPCLPALAAYYSRLGQRPAFAQFCGNGTA